MFLKVGKPRPIFVCSLQSQFYTTVGFNGIRTRIIGVEGRHAEHLSTALNVTFNKSLRPDV